MRPAKRSIWSFTRRVVGLFLLGVFLQWAGMINPASQEGTVYAEIADLFSAGSPGGSLAKLPPQQ